MPSWEKISAEANIRALRALREIRSTPKNLAVTDEKAWNQSLWNLWGTQSVSGENVNEYTALTYSAFWNGVNLYAGTISTLPLHLLRKTGKRKVPAESKPAYWVMYNQANPYMTAQALRSASMAHILTWGNSYCEIVRDGLGAVRELWPITPNRVKPKWQGGGIVYDVTVAGEIIPLQPSKVLHLHGLGFDGLMGYSVVAMARKSLGLGMAMETFGATYFGAGTHPSMIVQHPGKLTEEGSKNLRTALQDTYSGLGQAHRLMLLEEGMTANQITIPPEDSQFLQSRQFQVPEIARWLNLPPHKLKDLTRSSFSNIESEQISFVTDSILPWLVTLEQQYNMQLLTTGEQNQGGLFFRHNVEGLLRGDAASRATLYRTLWQVGAITINEIREREDWDPSDDEFADELFVPLNMVPTSLLREALEKKQEQAAFPKREPGQGGTEDALSE